MLLRRLAPAVAIVVGAVAVGACSVDGLAFRADSRVEIVEPPDRAMVSLPVTLRWTARDVDVATATTPGASFLVLVDRSPPPPGGDVRGMVDDEPGCEAMKVDACLEPASLAARNIYVTTATQLVLKSVAARVGVSDSERHRHEVTIVLLDDRGRRDGEATFRTEFRLRQP